MLAQTQPAIPVQIIGTIRAFPSLTMLTFYSPEIKISASIAQMCQHRTPGGRGTGEKGSEKRTRVAHITMDQEGCTISSLLFGQNVPKCFNPDCIFARGVLVL